MNKSLPACLWMQAGVVAKKKCYQDFSCTACRFDKSMRTTCKNNLELLEKGGKLISKKQKFVFWREKLRGQPLYNRPCIHHMKGHIDYKNCLKKYHCIDCEFDQYFHDQFKVYTVVKPVEFSDISGIAMPSGYYLHTGHTWVKIEDNNNVRIGIDDFASRILGQFDRIVVPLTGKEVVRDKPSLKAFRDDNIVEFQSPVSGVVTESNPVIRKDCSSVNKSPYTDGWVMRIHCKNLKSDLKRLLFMDNNIAFMEQEVTSLMDILENETGLMAADGGTLGNDLYGNAPGLSWDRLTKRFISRDL
ncbi:MAG: glycine cleavage system protein H [Desulfobacteraceae bacterium]|nr:glycine cleavage system protein H [Desulfobacteraceae bacterium]